ncbi:MAG TPA: hypothetical protein VL308_00500 [Gemmatimonadaceae bacterium]|jgi:hypothetical protein|nr:hypothetical protein [Gemmatimonadaceae bacterium]
MHPTISRSLAVIILSVMMPVITVAQSAAKAPDAQEPIPRELVLALLNLGPGMGGADIRVGKAPDDVPPDLLPPGIEILGSTTQFESSVIVLATKEQPDSAVARYEAHLLSAGWTKPPLPQARPMRGFVSAEAGQVTYDRPDMACRGEEFVTYSATYRRNGGSLVKVTYSRGNRYSMCKARQDVTAYKSPYDEAPVPLLRAPLGSITIEGGGMNVGSDNSFSLSTRLTTRLTPGELVEHYDKQMREQGWTSVGDGALKFLAAHTYRRNDDQGRPWIGMLFSLAMPDSSQQDATLRISRSQPSGAK